MLVDVADLLAGEDLRGLAFKYLSTGNSKQCNVAYLKERVYNSDSTRTLNKVYSRPDYPYQVEKIRVQMSIYTRAVP